jgi:hypothetical protein
MRTLVRGGSVASRTEGELANDRLLGVVLVGLVVLVLLGWGSALVYFGFHFLG